MLPLLTNSDIIVTTANSTKPETNPNTKPLDLCRIVQTNPQTNAPKDKQTFDMGVAADAEKSFIVRIKEQISIPTNVIMHPEATPIITCLTAEL